MNENDVDIAPDDADPEFAAAATAAWQPGASPDAYAIRMRHLDNAKPAEVMNQTRRAQEAAHAMGMPPTLAKAMFEQMSEGLAKQGEADIDHAALAVGSLKTRAYLERTFGADEAERMRVEAESVLQRASAALPWLSDALVRSGLGNSPWLVTTLSNVYRHSNRR